MRTKVLTGIVIAFLYIVVMSLALSALPPLRDLSGYWEWFVRVLNVVGIMIVSLLGTEVTIKWFCKSESSLDKHRE